ncbi:MAG: nickel pincer cofactor biosynthesis protein LarC [Planctomycetota bacterium]
MFHTHTHKHSGDSGGVQRGLREITQILRESTLPSSVQDRALRVFGRLAEVEGRAHGVDPNEVHFHEVGAIDSIVDIVGVCLGLDLLEIDEVRSGPVFVGSGSIDIAHGRVALPAPATIELLKGIPVEQRDTPFELTTPTGAAILAALATEFGPLPRCRVQSVGYGAGNDRPGPVPNCLRVIVADVDNPAAETSARRDEVVLLESNLDDMTAEAIGYLAEKLLSSGALDVFTTSILMKKGRPAHRLSVLAREENEETLVDLLFREATTLGIRRSLTERWVLDRRFVSVETPWGPIRIKEAVRGAEVVGASPEYEDVRTAAEQSGVAFREVYERALELYRTFDR